MPVSKLDLIDSLMTVSDYEPAMTKAVELEIEAKAKENYQLANESKYHQSKIFNRTNKFALSDSVISTVLISESDLSFYLKLKLLAYNNAMRLSDSQRALEILNSLQKHESKYNPSELLSYRTARADYYTIEEDYARALEYLLIAKKELPQNVSVISEFNLNYQLGAIYNAIGVYDQAVSIGIENQKLSQSNKDYYLELFSIFTQIEAYEKLSKFDEVDRLFDRAIFIKEEKNISTSFGFIYYTKGRSHYVKSELDSAMYYFNEGLKISKALKAKKEEFENIIGKGLVHLKLNEKAIARQCLEAAEKNRLYDHEDLNRLKIGLNIVDKDYKSAYINTENLLSNLESEGRGKYSYDIISTLLTDKFDQERRESQLLSNQKEEQKNNVFTLSLFGLAFSFLAFLLFLAQKNKRGLEKLNQDLQYKNEALLNYSYISSHDLKEPARNIASFTELLIERKNLSKSSAEYNEIIQIINNSSKTLLEIVKSLGIFSETALNEDIKLEKVDTHVVMEDVQRNLSDMITTSGAKVTFTQASGDPTIKYSKPMLYLLLKNLIQNAIKYNDKEIPKIDVTQSRAGDDYIFSVSDNGPGIRTDKLEYIFKPFKTLQNKSITQSSGLGLSICKNIVEKFGGKIWVKTNPEEGSIFSFTVPMK